LEFLKYIYIIQRESFSNILKHVVINHTSAPLMKMGAVGTYLKGQGHGIRIG